MTDAHLATLRALADPARRAGLRPDEREAVAAALAALAQVAAARDEFLASDLEPEMLVEVFHRVCAQRDAAVMGLERLGAESSAALESLRRERDALLDAALINVRDWWYWTIGVGDSFGFPSRDDALADLRRTLGLEREGG
jgi:hypothetical protein